jgi:hypothetical protein
VGTDEDVGIGLDADDAGEVFFEQATRQKESVIPKRTLDSRHPISDRALFTESPTGGLVSYAKSSLLAGLSSKSNGAV